MTHEPQDAPAPEQDVVAPRGDNVGLWKAATVVLAVIALGLAAALAQGAGSTTASPAPTATVTVTADGQADAPEAAADVEPVEPDPDQEQWLLDLPRREEGDPLAMGAVDAPIVLTEWADFRCPFCSVWAEDTLPELQRFVDDGSLRIEFRDLAIFGEDSVNAAAAARAAGEQGLFWEFSHALYSELPNEGHPPVGDDLVERIAGEVGVEDVEQFMATYRSDETRAAVEADTVEAQRLGIGSTPTFLVGSEVVAGAQPLEVFEAVIEEQLSRHGS